MNDRVKQLWSDLEGLLCELYKRFGDEKCLSVAASLSFTSLLALVPLITVVFSALSLFPVSDQLVESIEDFLFDNFVPAAGEAVQGYLNDFSDKAAGLTAVGLGFLLVSSLMLLFTIEDAFNDIWNVPRGRTIFQRLIVYWAVLTMGPLLIVGSLSMTSAFLSMPLWTEQNLIESFTQSVFKYLPILCEIVAFLLFYQAIPNVELKLKNSLFGAIVATILFETAKYGFGLYILNFNSYQLIYGALATIPIFFIWIYLSWVVLLVGALVAATLHERTEQASTQFNHAS